MSKVGEIAEGWTNLVLKKEITERIAKSRLLICNTCEFHSKFHKTLRPDAHCTDCGCTLNAKVRSLQTNCPQNKWKAIKKE
jgi:hypothetical protein